MTIIADISNPISTTPLSDYFNLIRPYAPGCADVTAKFGLRQAATDFLERTRLWRYSAAYSALENEPVAITTPAGSVLIDIEKAIFDDVPLEPKTTAWLDENMHGWRAGEFTGTPRYITQTEENTVILVPSATGTLSLYVWLKPSPTADELPEFMSEQHRTTLAHGALGYILAIPNQSFTNMDMGASFAASFGARLDKLFAKSSTGQQRARVRSKTSMF
jgi:hypothetical protein